ncbi:MAG TPA: hypothetical protein VIW03_09620, partial [Anaeromyxobacter sp.]
MERTIEPARRKPGVSSEDVEKRTRAGVRAAAAEGLKQDSPGALLRGEALIFWDPKNPGWKLDAIDTDQITPAA